MKHTITKILIITSTIHAHHIFGQDHSSSSFWTSIVAGTISGALKPFLTTPCVVLKNLCQINQTKSVTQYNILKHPQLLWKGTTTLSLLFSTSTALQIGCEKKLEQIGMCNPLGNSFCAGVISAYLLACPLEAIVLVQQINNCSTYQATQTIIKNHGPQGFLRGSTMCALRQGMFVLGYRSFAEECTSRIKPYVTNQLTCTLLGSILSAMITMIASHPCDTIKTFQQKDLAYKKQTLKLEIFKTQHLFKGIYFRLMTGMISIPFLNITTHYFEEQIKAAL